MDFTVDLVHLNQNGTPQNFDGEVALELVEPDSAAACAELATLANLGSAVFNDQERLTVTGLTHGDAIPAAQIRVTEVNPPGNSDPQQGCSSDPFTIRPHHLSLTASQGDWESPGTDQTLDAGSATEGPVHKAGHPFTLQGEALNEGGDPVTGFDETGVLDWSLADPPHEPDHVLGDYVPDAAGFPGDASGFRTDSAEYSEVGVLELTLTDEGNFAARSDDRSAGHCVTGSSSNTPDGEGRYGCRSATEGPATVGRFVPADFSQTVSDPGRWEGRCSGVFSYLGQPFGYAPGREPELAIEARNAEGGTTANYTGPFAQLEPADVARTPPGEDGSQEGRDGAPLEVDTVAFEAGDLTDNGDGTLTYTFSVDDELAYVRDLDRDDDGAIDTRVAPFQADLTVSVDAVEDADGVTATSLEDPHPESAEIRFGRLGLENAHGPELASLDVPVRAEHFDGERFAGNGADDCTSLSRSGAADAVRLELDDGGTWVDAGTEVDLVGGTGGTTEGTGVSGLDAGQGALTLAAPGEGSTGYVDLRANLADLPWLRVDRDGDGSFTEHPQARATFGRYRGDDRILYWQEVFP
ncbi:MAG: DUF6701 domain-containing protein [Thiohalorhabdus sp.]|uniref:DUF6701 domain-containing protein n=1 Tax=Thiohalorhabdus sp. TaxID=3094134 RepID=UPI00397FDC59